MAFNVENLGTYVKENQELLIKNFALVGRGTRGRIGVQTGIKSSAHLNYLNVGVTLQNGRGCGFNAAGDDTLTQRTISVAIIKVNKSWCPDDLRGKYAEYLVKTAAGEQELPFEEYIFQGVTNEINKKIEKLLWQGDTSLTSDTDLKWIDGYLKQMGADNAVVKETISSTSAYEGLLQVYMAMTEETLDLGGVIFVSPAIYRAFLQEMVRLNYFHYAGPQAAAPEEFILPGTDVKVIKTPGLAGSLKVVGTFAENLVYGTDMENDAEVFDFWFSQDDRNYKLEVKWASGAAYLFPEQIVLGTFGAAPVVPAGANAALNKLASAVNADGQIETHPNE